MRKILFTLFISLLLVSCDSLIGEKGVVVDSETGERISGVQVTLNNYSPVFSNENGFFSVLKLVGYFENDYDIKFEKEGYHTNIINEKYYSGKEAKFVTEGTRDTLIVFLSPKQAED